MIKYFLAQRTLAGFTVKSLRASPRNSSSIIRDFLILLRKLWSYSAFPERALLVLVTLFLILENIALWYRLSVPIIYWTKKIAY